MQEITSDFSDLILDGRILTKMPSSRSIAITILATTSLSYLTSALALAPRQAVAGPCGPAPSVPGQGSTCGPVTNNTGTTAKIYSVLATYSGNNYPLSYFACQNQILQAYHAMTDVPLLENKWSWVNSTDCQVGFWWPATSY